MSAAEWWFVGAAIAAAAAALMAIAGLGATFDRVARAVAYATVGLLAIGLGGGDPLMASPELTELFRLRIRAVGPLDAHTLHCLDVADAWVSDRVYPDDQAEATRHIDVTEAILILAHRLFTRRNSPEGVSGWGDLGVIRVMASDPDIRALLEYHIDHTNVGIA